MITLDTQTLISQGKMRSDCGDIRFTDSDGSTLLNYWLESGCNSANTKIWVKVPNIPANSNKTIYVYYGNPSATSQSNGDAVFEFFDDFEGTTLNTSKWSVTGDYSISNGVITINPNLQSNDGTIDGISVPDGIYSNILFPYPIELRTRIVSHTSYVRYRHGLLGIFYSYDDGGSGWWGLYLNQSRVVVWGYDVPGNGLIGNVITTINTTHFVLRDPSSNTPQTWNYGLNNNPNNFRIMISSWAASNIAIDYVTVRKYASPEPTIRVGNEESIKSITFNLYSSGSPSASLGNQFNAIIYLKNGTIIQRDFYLENECNLGRNCILGKATINLDLNIPIDKIQVCSRYCSLICSELKV